MKYMLHTHGFLRLYMPVQADGFIHVFSSTFPNRAPGTMIHDHPFGFDSEILEGRLESEVYNPVADEEGEYMKVTPEPGKRFRRLDELTYRLDIIEAPCYEKGTKYRMEERSVHKITGFKDVTLTKVIPLTKPQHEPIIYLHIKKEN